MKNAWQLEPFYWAPQRKPGGGWIAYKDAPSAPPAPDYTSAAIATASGNKEAAQAAQQGSMIGQNTPYGSLSYSQTGTSPQGNPLYTADISLSPTGQQLLSASDQTKLGLAGLQSGAEQRVAGSINQPFALGSVPQVEDTAYKAITSRLDPQWEQNTEMQDAKLANQGIVPGTKAYDDAMRTFNEAKNDAYEQANLGAIATAPQTFQLASATREQPLNELDALLTGSQVTNPTFGPTPQQQTVPGPNYLGAAQSQGQYGQGLYNAQIGQQNATTSGLFGLGGAGLNAYALLA